MWYQWFQWILSFFIKPVPQLPRFEDKYKLTAHVEEEEAYMKKRQVFETTPDGDIVLAHRDGMFVYWAPRPMPFKYLEVLARKYVLLYDCKELYVPMQCRAVEIKQVVLPPPYVSPAKPKKFKMLKQSNQYKWIGVIGEEPPPAVQQLTFRDFLNSKKNKTTLLPIHEDTTESTESTGTESTVTKDNGECVVFEDGRLDHGATAGCNLGAGEDDACASVGGPSSHLHVVVERKVEKQS